jgi:hypothetical protein
MTLATFKLLNGSPVKTLSNFFSAVCPDLTNHRANVGLKNERRKNMTKHIFNPDYHDCYEYHGNTTIELTRRQGEITLWRDWITFDTVQEAADYFNEHCSGYEYAGS